MHQSDTARAKQDLRAIMRKKRTMLTMAQRMADAQSLVKFTAVAPFKQARFLLSIGMYHAIKAEIDPGQLGAALRAKGHGMGLPCIEKGDKRLVFRRFEAGNTLIKGPFGISQPPQEAPFLHPDIVIVPLLAMDKKGGRLGYGGGYYDGTFLTNKRALLIGLGYDFQLLDQVPTGSHDIKLDYVMTPSMMLKT